ncbi:hypothetical protein V6Z11_A10G044800 [Gossypium hirsutum]
MCSTSGDLVCIWSTTKEKLCCHLRGYGMRNE